jgi:hypothetical protein
MKVKEWFDAEELLQTCLTCTVSSFCCSGTHAHILTVRICTHIHRKRSHTERQRTHRCTHGQFVSLGIACDIPRSAANVSAYTVEKSLNRHLVLKMAPSPVCMYVCVCVYVCMWTYPLYGSVYVCVRLYVSTYPHTSVHT